MLEKTRRWVRDQFAHDDGVTDHPDKVMDQLEASLAKKTPEHRADVLRYVSSYNKLYYNQRHRMEIPQKAVDRLGKMDRDIKLMNSAAEAKKIVAEYGGPPTKELIAKMVNEGMTVRQREDHKVKLAEYMKAPERSAVKESAVVNGKAPSEKKREHVHSMVGE